MKFERFIEYENDFSDFQMPYKIFGNLDKEIMLDRYKRLSNKPTHILETRFLEYQW